MLASSPATSTKIVGDLFEVVLHHRVDHPVPRHLRSINLVQLTRVLQQDTTIRFHVERSILQRPSSELITKVLDRHPDSLHRHTVAYKAMHHHRLSHILV